MEYKKGLSKNFQNLSIFANKKKLVCTPKILQLASTFKWGWTISLVHAFECSRCKKTPTTLPLIACQGCSSLIGCELCVKTWYTNDRSMVKNCPKCWVERGLSKTFVLRGFEELIHQLKILREETSTVSDTGSDYGDDE